MSYRTSYGASSWPGSALWQLFTAEETLGVATIQRHLTVWIRCDMIHMSSGMSAFY